jgi:hypothetical protein
MYNNRHLSPLGLQPNNLASVDKVQLWTDNFLIDPKSDIDIQPHILNLSDSQLGQKEYQSPLLTLSDGTDIHASKAYKNTDSFNLSIQRKSGRAYLTVSFNPNKLSHYYKPLTDYTLRNTHICSVRDSIHSMGIDFDFEGSKLTRLDLAKDKQFPKALSNYHPILQSVSAKRQSGRAYFDTYTIGNQSHQTVIYDKSLESKIPNMSNLIRCEVRALKGRSVSNFMGMKSVSDLMESDSDTLTSIYNKHLRDRVFVTYSPDKHEIETELKLLQYFMEKSSQNWVSNYLQHSGVFLIIEKFGSIESFVTHLQDLGLSRQKSHRWKHKLIIKIRESLSIQNRAKSEIASLYDHIYSFAV